MGRRSDRHFNKKNIQVANKCTEKKLNIISHERNAHHSHTQIHPHSHEDSCTQEDYRRWKNAGSAGGPAECHTCPCTASRLSTQQLS